MTVPDERTRAVLWGGAFLIEIHSDQRVPLEHRKAAAHIARHFPTVTDVAQMSRLAHPNDGGGMFEHPDQCHGWKDGCSQGWLTEGTRLRTPTIESEVSAEEIDRVIQREESGEIDGADPVASLDDALESLREAKTRWDVRAERVYHLCRQIEGELDQYFDALDWSVSDASQWLLQECTFDDSMSGATLIRIGRGKEVVADLRALAKDAPPPS